MYDINGMNFMADQSELPRRAINASIVITVMEQFSEQAHYPFHIATLGGGTGQSLLIKGAQQLYTGNIFISAIVNTYDNGGSSGQMVQNGDISLPPGDARQCISALAGPYGTVYEQRWLDGIYAGSPIGNLELARLEKRFGTFQAAVDFMIQKHGDPKNEVIPVSTRPGTIIMELADGTYVTGEEQIGEVELDRRQPFDISIDTQYPFPNTRVIDAIRKSNAIVIAAGNPARSIMPVLATPGIRQLLRAHANIPFGMVLNLVNTPQTLGWAMDDYVDAYSKLAGRDLDFVVYNTEPVGDETSGTHIDTSIRSMRVGKYIGANLLAHDLKPAQASDPSLATRNRIVHDPSKLAHSVLGAVQKQISSSLAIAA
jgi:uncharacterized cofD-like protein